MELYVSSSWTQETSVSNPSSTTKASRFKTRRKYNVKSPDNYNLSNQTQIPKKPIKCSPNNANAIPNTRSKKQLLITRKYSDKRGAMGLFFRLIRRSHDKLLVNLTAGMA
jgi:hypothetical protein